MQCPKCKHRAGVFEKGFKTAEPGRHICVKCNAGVKFRRGYGKIVVFAVCIGTFVGIVGGLLGIPGPILGGVSGGIGGGIGVHLFTKVEIEDDKDT